jgi:hypothetical protein
MAYRARVICDKESWDSSVICSYRMTAMINRSFVLSAYLRGKIYIDKT